MIFFGLPFWLILSLLLSGCASATQTVTPEEKSVANLLKTDNGPTPPTSYLPDASDLERLARLWKQRSQEGSAIDYPIGPGDVLEISVPAMEELKERTVRVSGEGTISLPFIGKSQAGGLTEEKLREEIRGHLQKYMHNPRVIIFVKEYRSRQVALLGAVGKPGHYGLNSGGDTILDMLSRAGGISAGADPRIHLIPAEPVEHEKAKEVASTLPDLLLSQDPSPLILKRTDPILIDLKELAYGGYQDYLSLPLRPGDVIMVPGGGQVLVEGWVQKPGAYGVTPGLTASGVVAAAGGPLFAADTSAVKIIRTERGGKKLSFLTDLEKIKRGEAPDITLQGGDIVEVSSEPGKLIAYNLYRFFSTVINIGISGSVPLFGR